MVTPEQDCKLRFDGKPYNDPQGWWNYPMKCEGCWWIKYYGFPQTDESSTFASSKNKHREAALENLERAKRGCRLSRGVEKH